MTSKRQPHRRRLPLAKLDEMIEEATVDAYGESEQTFGFFTLLEEQLKLPFKTEVLGLGHGRAEGICRADQGLAFLPLPLRSRQNA